MASNTERPSVSLEKQLRGPEANSSCPHNSTQPLLSMLLARERVGKSAHLRLLLQLCLLASSLH